MEALQQLSKVGQRKAAAVLGALVADAAARPLHWLYDVGALSKIIEGQDDYTFLASNHCKFYELPTGASSAYGDSVKPYLASLADKKQADVADWLLRLRNTFGGDDNPYQVTKKERDAHPEFWKTFDWHATGPWLSHVMEHFVKAYDKDAKAAKLGDPAAKDTDGYNTTIALTAFLAPDAEEGKTPELDLAAIRPSMEHLMGDEAALARNLFMSELLFQAVVSKAGSLDVAAAVTALRDKYAAKGDDVSTTVAAEVDAVLAEAGNKDHTAVVDKFGKACPTPGSFQSTLHTVLVFGADYKAAVLAEIAAGGDQCGRCVMSTSIIAALGGLDSIPPDWLAKTDAAADAIKLCQAAFS